MDLIVDEYLIYLKSILFCSVLFFSILSHPVLLHSIYIIYLSFEQMGKMIQVLSDSHELILKKVGGWVTLMNTI